MKNTIKNFMTNNWSTLIEVGVVVGAEVAVVTIYKNYVKKMEKDLFGEIED